LAATAIAAWLPRRVSPRKPSVLWPVSAITQRIRPVRTSIAIHDAGTELSRPEKPPRPATSAFCVMIASAAELWLETPIAPPPWARA